MSLYRTYRPQSLTDIVGQDHITSVLRRALETDKLAHAFLLSGSRGTGKTSIARILAKEIMLKGVEDEALQNQITKGIEEGNIVDLLEIDAASNRGIDDVRDLIEKIQFSPVVASAKVYIIDEVHMLTKEAFNALLKTLEEPPSYAYFVLATTELHKIPVTIQSRCQRYQFRRISEQEIIQRLQFIADQEKIQIERPALRAIAHDVEGGLRDAISLLDQLRSLPNITLDDVRQRLGSLGQEHIDNIFAGLEAKDQKAIVNEVRLIEEGGIAMDVLARSILKVARQKLHDAIDAGTDTLEYESLLSHILSALSDIRSAPVPGLVVEAALLGFCNEGAALPPSPKAQKETPAPQKSPEPPKEEAKKEEPKQEPEPEAPQATFEATPCTLDGIRTIWPTILDEITPASVKMSLKNGRVAALEDNTVTIQFSSDFHRNTAQDASRSIEELLFTHLQHKVGITYTVETEGQKIDGDEEISLAEAAAEIF